MNKKDVIISIKGQHFHDGDDGEPGEVEFITSGFLSLGKDGYVLSYREDGDGEATDTTLLVQGAKVTLLRSGGVSSQMIFEQGRRHLSFYDTDEGPLTVGVRASSLRAEINEFGGDIELDYDVEVDSSMTAGNHVKISVREAAGKYSPQRERGVYRAPFVN